MNGLPDSDDAIRLDKRADQNSARWGLLLVIFMRLVAALWIVQGLSQWQVVLLVEGNLFDRVPPAVGVSVVVFGVMDLVAAIGLWLATPWGGVLWILLSFAQIVTAILLPDFFAGGRLIILLDAVLLGLYLFLTFQAAHEADPAAGRMGGDPLKEGALSLFRKRGSPP